MSISWYADGSPHCHAVNVQVYTLRSAALTTLLVLRRGGTSCLCQCEQSLLQHNAVQRSLAQNSTAQKSSSKHSLIKNEERMTPGENRERIASKMMMHLFLILVRPGCFLFTHVNILPLSCTGIPLFVFFSTQKISLSIFPILSNPMGGSLCSTDGLELKLVSSRGHAF